MALTHGRTRTSEYGTWAQMRRRCLDISNQRYKDYGGRGITICERWQSFENFFEDMGVRPEGMTLERIDNDGPYSPDNCRWATPSEQAKNRRSNISLTVHGETLTVEEWSKRANVTARNIYQRLRRGWPAERVIANVSQR